MEATVKQQLHYLMEGANVVRFHSRPGLRPNTVGHHSHGALVLAWILSEGKISAKGLMKIARHDLGEQVVSDVSSPAKRLLGIREQLQKLEDQANAYHGFEDTSVYVPAPWDADEDRWLAMADLFDLLMYCCDEAALGNKYVNLIMTRCCLYIEQELTPLRRKEREVYNAIVEIYKENTNAGPTFDCYYR